MKKNNIVLKYYTIENEKLVGTIDREEFLEEMKNLKATYHENNVISSKFVDVIPEIDEIIISQITFRDNPLVAFIIDGVTDTIEIPWKHVIVWSKLFSYCGNCK